MLLILIHVPGKLAQVCKEQSNLVFKTSTNKCWNNLGFQSGRSVYLYNSASTEAVGVAYHLPLNFLEGIAPCGFHGASQSDLEIFLRMTNGVSCYRQESNASEAR